MRRRIGRAELAAKNAVRKHKRHHSAKNVAAAGDAPLRFRNIEKASQDCLERMGITTYEQLQGAVDKYGADGLVSRMEDTGYTPPKHEKWRLTGAVRGKDWKDMLKEMQREAKAKK